MRWLPDLQQEFSRYFASRWLAGLAVLESREVHCETHKRFAYLQMYCAYGLSAVRLKESMGVRSYYCEVFHRCDSFRHCDHLLKMDVVGLNTRELEGSPGKAYQCHLG